MVTVCLGTAGLIADRASAGTSCLLQVTAERGLLTVDALGAPLNEVLRAIGQQAGLRVSVDGDLNDPVTQSFRQLPLGEGIRRLTRGHSLSLVYASDRGLGAPALTAVHVYTGSWSQSGLRAARLRSLRALTDRRDPPAIGALIRMLGGDRDPVVRSQTAVALGRLGGPRAAAALNTALRDQAPSVRCQAVVALLRVQGEAAARALGGVLQGDPDPRIRRTAARALGSLRAAEARRALEAARSDPDESVRSEVTRVLRSERPGLSEPEAGGPSGRCRDDSMPRGRGAVLDCGGSGGRGGFRSTGVAANMAGVRWSGGRSLAVSAELLGLTPRGGHGKAFRVQLAERAA